MKRVKMKMLTYALVGAGLLSGMTLSAQCENWNDNPQQEEAETAHVLYRQSVKQKDFDGAYEQWKIAYDIAPAADGQRPFHYSDGRKIFLHKFNNAADDAKKTEYGEMVLKLYDQEIECYENEAYLLGRKAFDMFYTLRTPYTETYEVLQAAVEKGGNDSEYIVLDPFAHVAVYMYTNELLDKEQTREWYNKLNAIADHNIENDSKYKAQYEAAKASMNGKFREIENYIFDCAYWQEKLLPQFEENPDDGPLAKELYNKLIQQGCTADDPLLQKLKGKYEAYAAQVNAQLQAEFEANNPAFLASKAYKAGDYDGAIAKYEEAIAKETDNSKKASYYFSIASIQFRKKKQYSTARASARKAAELRSGWGQPYMLIGDMYASTSNSCGKDAWSKSLATLAAVEKYAYAKSIDSDPELAADANKKIARYRAYRPEKQEGFMRQVTEGSSQRVGCWIGETVTVRFQ